jgi:hypothetical protein
MIASLLLIANTINIGADISAMAASVRLIFPQTPTIAATISFAAFILASEILLPYEKYGQQLQEGMEKRKIFTEHNCHYYHIRLNLLR